MNDQGCCLISCVLFKRRANVYEFIDDEHTSVDPSVSQMFGLIYIGASKNIRVAGARLA